MGNSVLPMQNEIITVSQPTRDDNERVSIFQWNVLAMELAHGEWSQAKDRKEKLLAKIDEIHADVICLQELDNYFSFWRPQLKKIGYNVAKYEMRTTSNVSVHSNILRHDGTGIFYNHKKFSLLAACSFRFHDGSDRLFVITGLQSLTTNKIFQVASTHLYYKSNEEAYRVRQLEFISQEMHNFRDLLWELTQEKQHTYEVVYPSNLAKAEVDRTAFLRQIKVCCNIPMFLSGDFNSVPRDGKSLVYHFMEHNFSKFAEYEVRGPRDSRSELKNEQKGIAEMKSAYKINGKIESVPTSYNSRRKNGKLLDYIWYTLPTARVLSVMKISKTTYKEMQQSPSDHLPLFATFELLNVDQVEKHISSYLPNTTYSKKSDATPESMGNKVANFDADQVMIKDDDNSVV